MKVPGILSVISLTAVFAIFSNAKAQPMPPGMGNVSPPQCDEKRCKVLFVAYKMEGQCKPPEVDVARCKEIFFQDQRNIKECGGCKFTDFKLPD